MNESEQTLYGIPISQLKGTRYGNGTLYDMNGYDFYVPDNVDDSTAAFVYYPGSGGSKNDAKLIRETITNGTAEQIIIIADSAYENKEAASTRYNNLINNIAAENSATVSNIATMGFSAGGPATLSQLMYNVRSNPDKRYNAVFCDVVNISPSNEDVQLLKENESTILFLEPNGSVLSGATKMAQGGVDVVIAWTNGSHAAHVALNKEAFQNGIIDYATGVNTELANADIYNFVQYNAQTGKWESITLEELTEKYEGLIIDSSNPYRYYDKLTGIMPLESNNEFLGSKINVIRGLIKNTSFLSNTSGDIFDSTTNIPQVEGDLVQSFLSATSNLLVKLEKDTASIIKIGNLVEEVNTNLDKEADDLNNKVTDVTNTNNSVNNNVSTNNTYNGNNVVTNNSSNNISSNNTSNNGSSKPVIIPGDVISNNEVDKEISLLVTGITKVVTDLEETIEDRLDNDIKYIDDEINDKNSFLKYDELYSDDKILVFDSEDGFKVVVHYEEDKIVGLDYYYEFKDKKQAESTMKELIDEYDSVEAIIQEDKYLRLSFKDDLYKDLSINDIKEVYKDYKELIKEEE